MWSHLGLWSWLAHKWARNWVCRGPSERITLIKPPQLRKLSRYENCLGLQELAGPCVQLGPGFQVLLRACCHRMCLSLLEGAGVRVRQGPGSGQGARSCPLFGTARAGTSLHETEDMGPRLLRGALLRKLPGPVRGACDHWSRQVPGQQGPEFPGALRLLAMQAQGLTRVWFHKSP